MLQYTKKGWYVIMKLSIQEKLKEQNMSRYELAKRIGVTYPTIDNIYKGNSTSIKLDILEAICRELKCTPIDILVPEDPFVGASVGAIMNILLTSNNKSDTNK